MQRSIKETLTFIKSQNLFPMHIFAQWKRISYWFAVQSILGGYPAKEITSSIELLLLQSSGGSKRCASLLATFLVNVYNRLKMF